MSAEAPRGFVSLVGAGPGDPGLLTVRGRRAIERADVVLYDLLAHPALLASVEVPGQERIHVGKRAGAGLSGQGAINGLIVRRAKAGQRVVLEMGAPWCPPCKRAKALLAEDAFAAELDNVVVLRADSDVWGEDLDALGFDAPVIPVYYRLGDDGMPSGESVRGDRWKNRTQVRSGLLAFLSG